MHFLVSQNWLAASMSPAFNQSAPLSNNILQTLSLAEIGHPGVSQIVPLRLCYVRH